MEDDKFEEGLEPSVQEIENPIKNVVNEVSEESEIVPAIDGLKATVQEVVESVVTGGAEEPLVNEVNEPAKEETKNTTPADQTKVPTGNESSNQTETTSKRVREGQKWNDRNREKIDYTKNIKSDFTSQVESSDPIAIRKQVSCSPTVSLLVELTVSIRSSFTSPIPTSCSTNSSSQKSKAPQIFLSQSASFIPSNACATFNP